MVSSWHNKSHSPETEIKPSKDGVRLPTWQSIWKWSRTQSSHPMQCTCTSTYTGVGAHTGRPSACSTEECYNNWQIVVDCWECFWSRMLPLVQLQCSCVGRSSLFFTESSWYFLFVFDRDGVLEKPPPANWLFHVSIIHQTDMEYRIVNVRTWSFICMCIHTGLGHTDSESAQPFWLGKTQSCFCAPDGIWTLDLWNSSPMF